VDCARALASRQWSEILFCASLMKSRKKYFTPKIIFLTKEFSASAKSKNAAAWYEQRHR
jgi:hypothetical protein